MTQSRILKSLHGREIGLDYQGGLVVPNGAGLGDMGSFIALPSPRTISRFDDFTGGTQAFSTTITNGWRSRKGSDAQCVDWTVTDSAINGTAVATIGDTTASMAVSGVQLDGGLIWKANQGEVAFETRVKMSQITTIAVFVGFTDQVAALEMPIHAAASADTITTNATDGVGFFFDTSMTTDNWWASGVANDVDATHQNLGVAPVADTWETLRVELTTAGAARFYRNGKQIGSLMSGAVTATVALTPVIAGFNRNTSGTPTLHADYVHVSGLRG